MAASSCCISQKPQWTAIARAEKWDETNLLCAVDQSKVWYQPNAST
jgi:hypothetical protein